MSHFIDICLLCLNKKSDLKLVKSKDTNDIVNKLKYCLSENDLTSNISTYICGKCENSLNNFYEFKQKCLQNMATYKKLAQQITTTDNYKYSELPTESNVIINVKTEQIFLQESVIKKESLLEENPAGNVQAPIKVENICVQDEFDQYECYICLEKYLDKDKLESHILSHTTKVHKCQNCNKEFSNIEDLEQHLKIHPKTSEKLFTCGICNKSFKISANLKKHKLIHTGEKPFTCEVCNESFRQSSTLKTHKLIHTGEKPFTCEICQKSFRRLEHLKQHKLVHTGEKSFSCEVCKQSFRRSDHLKQHKIVHTGEKPFSCDVCNISMRDFTNLKRHKLIHIGEKSNKQNAS